MKRHKWSDIKARAKPDTRTRMEAEARRLSDDLHLSQLRKARGLTQETMAELLGVSQAEVSKMERRTELYVGTLQPGQTVRFTARRLWIRMGAPWNLDAHLNGKPVTLSPALGNVLVTGTGVTRAP